MTRPAGVDLSADGLKRQTERVLPLAVVSAEREG
jgi:hypothetical protein